MLACSYKFIEIAALQYILEGVGYYFYKEIYEKKCYCQYFVILVHIWIAYSKAPHI